MSVRARWAVATAAVVLLAAGAALLLWLVGGGQRSPEDAALAYLEAAGSGDPAAVAATGVELSDAAVAAFPAATELITDAKVVGTEGGEDDATATVTVSFRLGGESHRGEVPLILTDGRWIPDAGALGTLSATTTIGSSVAVGDATVPSTEEVRLVPAGYEVIAAPADLLEGTAPVTVFPGTGTDAEIEDRLRPEATEAAQTQLDALLEECARTDAGGEVPAGCGIRIPWGTEFSAVDELRLRIEQLPVIDLGTGTGDGTGAGSGILGFTAGGGVLVATLSGIGQDGAARTTTYRTDSWSVRGDASFTAEGLTLTVW